MLQIMLQHSGSLFTNISFLQMIMKLKSLLSSRIKFQEGTLSL